MPHLARKVKLHVHKYKKFKQYKNGNAYIFRCMLPNCSHYIPESLLEGKASVCWGCGKEFILGPRAKYSVQPKCKACKRKSNRGNPNWNAQRELPVREIDLSSPTKLSILSQQLANAIERDDDEDD